MNAYIESFKIQIFLYITVDFVDTLAVLWIAAVYFKTVTCLGEITVKQCVLTLKSSGMLWLVDGEIVITVVPLQS